MVEISPCIENIEATTPAKTSPIPPHRRGAPTSVTSASRCLLMIKSTSPFKKII